MRRDLGPDDDAIALIRGCGDESLVLVMRAGRDPVGDSQVRAAIGPLAMEIAPRRVNLVAMAEGADDDAVDALVAYLETAESTTGQIVEIS